MKAEIAEEHEQQHSNEVQANRRPSLCNMYLLPDFPSSAVAHVS